MRWSLAMTRIAAAALVVTCISILDARAQLWGNEPIQDTVSVRDYAPLDIGNAWEYRQRSSEWPHQVVTHAFSRHQVSGDTTINGKTVSIVEQVLPHDTTAVVRRDLIYFSEVDSTFRAMWWDAEGNLVDRCIEGWGCEIAWPFYSESPAVFITPDPYDRTEWIIGPDTLSEIRTKYFGHLSGGSLFVHGIGLVEEGGGHGMAGGFEHSRHLTYARIRGVEMGIRHVASSITQLAVRPKEALIESIYPIPTAGRLTISTDPEAGERLDVALFDLVGRRILAEQFTRFGNNVFELNIEAIPPGVYVLRVLAGQRMESRVVVVAR